MLVAVLALRVMDWREQQDLLRPLTPRLGVTEAVLPPILPLEPIAGLDPERVALGERLFHDPRLSADMTVSCASCHDLAAGGADGRQFSLGIGGAVGAINAPTVFNSAYSLAQFWDGRAATLEEQVGEPLQSPIEMGATWSQVLGRLALDDDLAATFSRLYPDGLTAANLADAIATFERSLVTVNSRFDRYLRGDEAALNAQELVGYERFLSSGCASCHQGKLVGGNMYQRFGVLSDYFAGRPVSPSDLGRYNVTGKEEDRFVFKVPSLRNVAETAPYFHDGSVKTLKMAVSLMARYQLGHDLPADDIDAIVAFLKTLSGELPGAQQ
ncbi:MAG: cytochrome-c peroxidase [Azonexus sp.]|nr:cytochrome-c peroxidase [Azonexus sp.]